jgi:hypothetical protein
VTPSGRAQGFSWTDAQPAIETAAESAREINDAVHDPSAFLKKIWVAVGHKNEDSLDPVLRFKVNQCKSMLRSIVPDAVEEDAAGAARWPGKGKAKAGGAAASEVEPLLDIETGGAGASGGKKGKKEAARGGRKDLEQNGKQAAGGATWKGKQRDAEASVRVTNPLHV